MKNLTALLAVLIISLQVFSRELPGYYLNEKGDTIHCTFVSNFWKTTPESIDVTVGTQTSTLQPYKITGFGIDGIVDYVSRDISFHPGNFTFENAADEYPEEITTKKSFLKVLAQGKYNLYELALTGHSYYFVEDADGVKELVYRLKKDGLGVTEDHAYRQQIFACFTKESLAASFVNEITNSEYDGKSITSLFRRLNEKISGVKYEPPHRGTTSFEVFGGGLYTVFSTQLYGRSGKPNIKFDPAIGMTTGIAFIHHPTRWKRNAAVGASLGYGQVSSSLTNHGGFTYDNRTVVYTEDLTLTNSTFMLDVFGLYYPKFRGSARPYVKAGINGNMGLTKIKQKYVSKFFGSNDVFEKGGGVYNTNKFYSNFHGGIGINPGRHKVEVNYYTAATIYDQFRLKSSMIGVLYFYSLTR